MTSRKTSAGSRYGINEWYGQVFTNLSGEDRSRLAREALDGGEQPACSFQIGRPPCSKKHGVCSIVKYTSNEEGRIESKVGAPVIVCPNRFEQEKLLLRWLVDIVEFSLDKAMVAREVPFLRSTATNKPAGKIDLVIAQEIGNELKWFGLEIQAVYFSGKGMSAELEILSNDTCDDPPFPGAVRRPDWRSSSAKRLMPQLETKVPTLRRWGSKVAVAVDQPFFEAIGGKSDNYSQILTDGDIIWMVPRLTQDSDGSYKLSRGHWEVLTLEASTKKLRASETIGLDEFEDTLRKKLALIK